MFNILVFFAVACIGFFLLYIINQLTEIKDDIDSLINLITTANDDDFSIWSDDNV